MSLRNNVIASTKCHGSTVIGRPVEALLLRLWPTRPSLAGVSILVSPQMAGCVNEWISLGGSVCIMRLTAPCVWKKYTARKQVHCTGIFCMVSADVPFSVECSCPKGEVHQCRPMAASWSTTYVLNKRAGPTRTSRYRMSYWIKWETLLDKDV